MICYIVFLPLLGALFSGIFTNKISAKFAEYLTTGLMLVSAVLSYVVFVDVIFNGQIYCEILLRWVALENLYMDWALYVDNLTAVMLVVVNTVSFLVHLYSIGYMHEDEHRQRFMSYLSLFTFFMLMLVTSHNFIQLFLGWEGVGLCSYLLIGFWYKKPSATSAAMKAFLVNRVADFGFAIGLFTIFYMFNSLDFLTVLNGVEGVAERTINLLGAEFRAIDVACFFLFIGCMGKSAQIGLHTWLPDAMEGPTPVSALIHAATMVTAGVFLLARCSPLFEYSVCARNMIVIVGSITCLFAATIALTQNDIKKIIAYSTCSQLGYMFMAAGVSAYSAGVFHLFTHAFFKALLFLSAGSVIHAVVHEQDIRKMGGLYKKLPLTYTFFWIGSLAIAGIYPLAGYFSKDAILEAAFASGDKYAMFGYWCGIIAAFCTAFYSFRLIFKVFHGKWNGEDEHHFAHAHEAPKTMMIPLIVLSVGAIISGITVYKMGIVDIHSNFWNGAIKVVTGNMVLENMHHIPEFYALLPSIVGVLGITLAFFCYILVPSIMKKLPFFARAIEYVLYNKYFVDEIYNCVFIKSFKAVSWFSANIIDRFVIDEFGPRFAAASSSFMGKVLSSVQTGRIYHYVFVMLLSLVVLLTWFLLNVIPL